MHKNDELHDKNADLVAALEAVEWVDEAGSMIQTCPWCRNGFIRGHADDCQRQQALEPEPSC